MLKAAALYLVLVISLIVSVILGSLIYLAFFFREQEARIYRSDILSRQIEAGYMLGSSRFFPYVQDTVLTDVLQAGDSVRISRYEWGLYDVLRVGTAIQRDSLMKAVMLGVSALDSTVLYLSDEDRPVSVSGETVIRGTAYLPKSGIRPSYVDGEYYKGYPDIIAGKSESSQREMPAVNSDRIVYLSRLPDGDPSTFPYLPDGSVRTSFYTRAQRFMLQPGTILTDSLMGNMILYSDTTVRVSQTAFLQDVLLVAPSIRIEKGFRGSAQFFASDSLIVEDYVTLDYPSTLGLLAKRDDPSGIRVGNGLTLWGTLFLWEDERSDIPKLVSLGKDCRINGNICIYGLLDYSKGFQVDGTVSCYRFLYRSPSSMYENFLVGTRFDRGALSKNFLGSYLRLNGQGKGNNKPLKWFRHE